MATLQEKLRTWSGRRLPMIVQTEAAECGLACVAMVASMHGYQTDLNSLRQRFSLSLEGCTLLDLMHIAEQLQLSSRPLKIELEELSDLATPCILHWDLNHFVVLKSVNTQHCIIHDPALGVRRISLTEVSKSFTGIALELTPTATFTAEQAKQSLTFSSFFSKITGLKQSLGLLLSLSVFLQLFILASPYYIQLVVDAVIISNDGQLLLVLALGFALLLLFDVATNALRSLVLLNFSSQLSVQLASNLFHHLVRLPLAYFEKRHMGDLVSRFGSLRQLRELLTTGIIEAIIDGFMALGVLCMIFFYSPLLSLVVLVAVLAYYALRLALYRSLRLASEQQILALAGEQSNFMETIRAIQTVKLFGFESQREAIWQNHYVKATNRTITLGKYEISYQIMNKLLFGTENIVVIYLAAELVMAGSFTTGMLFAFIAYKAQFMERMSKLIEKLIEYRMLSLHFERIADIALTAKEQTYPPQPMLHKVAGNICLQQVSFSYSSVAEPVLYNLALQINAGESVAIIGPSGCGKSTLMKLLLGLLTPTEGEILIDDIPLVKLGLAQYRQQVAAVMQEDRLLGGTIEDNITFFSEKIDVEKLTRCAQMAAIHQDICQMPMGYKSLIGDMGSALSSGQKQRLILARALYREPKILFMDEATSHLDIVTESVVNQAMKKLNITRVVIAHRPETIKAADRVIDLTQLLQRPAINKVS
ncbi:MULTISPECIES: peptidase domain-containing ABC transporter [unclassified Shewanella]|uniref:peptidase domain-containing ABC transporter n=1 Tax=Shewanella TaxID=22 RepID=UPI0021D87D40|nr:MULTISPECIES: peptidase domain-containing ABC transporter [unclassified Shewanella]MCU7988249.1 peptidase domain-containing ABC transporter [Shewanella sp. SW24]MCU8024268.1 peptidase domain-containing ABC transporter [Shewanella sp. SM78]MCU8032421.1 peptidase domain-containing ABC transporter [Shewanella sp. SM73]MCU8042059.1 peptidase domain-containing ABC transporter [Shewanella sp. SM68]MCU8046922.1 peptidase domain-containing ABC transporter [Shewanella sp. SM65]